MGLKGGPTQDEIMAISLQKLGLMPGDVFADIGCGTGKIAIAASERAARVYAVDRRPEAIACARDQATRAGVTNIEFYEGDAVDFLKGIDALDCAFVGGSQHLSGVLGMLAEKERLRSIVVNAVMVETLHEAISCMQRLGIFREAVHVQVARTYPIAGSVMFRPIDPVYIIVGEMPCS